MTCCIEKSSIFAAAFGKCIYKVSNIQYYFNQKNSILASIGHSVLGNNRWSLYLGIGIG